MKERRRKDKQQPRPPAENPPDLSSSDRFRSYADSSQGRFALPAIVAVLTLLVGVWTFDAKLSLSGDNTEFITLARSMAAGEGLLHINSPDPQPATKYPFGLPLLLAPMQWFFPGDWVPMKAWVLVVFAAGMGALYQLAKERVGAGPALAVVVLSLTAGKSYLTHGPDGLVFGPLLLHYSHQIMSEAPYLTFSLLALWLVERGIAREGIKDNWWLIGGFGCTMWAYYIRTAGITLIAAVVVYMLLRRDYRRGLIFGGAAVACWLPWTLRNKAVGGGGVYIEQLFMVNPYHPDRGLLDFAGFVERFIGHIGLYLTRELPNTLVPFFDSAETIFHPASLLLILLAVAATVFCVKRGENLLLLVYAAFFMGVVLLWPWPGDRFLIPIVPVLVFLAVWVVLKTQDILVAKGGAGVSKVLVWALLCICLVGQVAGVKRLADYAEADYPPPWSRYYQAGLWLKANTSEDAIVLCRKGYWMYIVSGRRCIGFPFEEPAQVLAYMEREQADYVVLESLGFPQTVQYLVPAVNEYRDRFEALWQDQTVPTYVLRFLKQ
ncbi:MAG: hypothetical protein OSB73_18975 [Candidatus Latescibacteria bacterium]|nr:hypothetical protein [Candidatus Latescibacterota bacterium]